MSAGWTIILLICAFFCFSLVLCKKYQQVEVEIKRGEDGKPLKIFTADDIAEFDGSDPSKPIYLAVRGVVFDVSKGKDFYSTGSDYQVLAGKDASRAHALWSLDPKDLTHDLTGLTDDQLKGLDEVFEKTYLAKYPVVGYMSYLIKQKKTAYRQQQKEEF